MSRKLEICAAIILIGTYWYCFQAIGWIFCESFELFQMEFIWFPGFSPWSLCFHCNFSRFSGTNKMRWLHSFPPCWTSVQHCQIVKMCRGLEIVHQPLRLRQSLEEGLRMTRISRDIFMVEIGHKMFILWHCNFSHINNILFLARGVWTEFRRFENHPQLATSRVMIVPCLLVKGRPRYVFWGAIRATRFGHSRTWLRWGIASHCQVQRAWLGVST